MATHSSVLAWRIPGTGEPGGNVKPVTVGKVPIVGVIDVVPLKAVTTVVVEVAPVNAPLLSVENTRLSFDKFTT